MDQWVEKRILILGMTYPSYSNKYVENTCTGGLEEWTGKMVRIHPVPARYLEPEHRFKTFQWIKARVMKHPSDPRPESLRIDPLSIEPQEEITSENADLRRQLVEKSPHLFKSVEELKDRWEADRTSLGTIRPREILGVRLVRRPDSERQEWLAKEKALLSQEMLPFERPPKPIDFPETEFRVSWRCDDARCKTHEMNIAQWGLHELYRKLADDPARDAKVKDKMTRELDLKSRDVFLFLGNYREIMWNFGLMDSFSPGKQRQVTMGW